MTSSRIKINKSIYSLVASQLLADVKFKYERKLLNKEPNIPWMRFREIEIIKDLLINLKPQNCLEWGAGTGTMFFTQFIPPDAKWVSIEHNKEWAESVIDKNQNSNVDIVFKSPTHEAIPGMYSGHINPQKNDGTYEDFKDYIEYPCEYAPFDFIMIDGRARSACLKKSKDLLSKNGVVLLHDANRKYYHEAFQYFDKDVLFFDQREVSGGMWIGTNGDKEISDFIDVHTYRKLWKLYNRIGKIVKV